MAQASGPAQWSPGHWPSPVAQFIGPVQENHGPNHLPISLSNQIGPVKLGSSLVQLIDSIHCAEIISDVVGAFGLVWAEFGLGLILVGLALGWAWLSLGWAELACVIGFGLVLLFFWIGLS